MYRNMFTELENVDSRGLNEGRVLAIQLYTEFGNWLHSEMVCRKKEN